MPARISRGSARRSGSCRCPRAMPDRLSIELRPEPRAVLGRGAGRSGSARRRRGRGGEHWGRWPAAIGLRVGRLSVAAPVVQGVVLSISISSSSGDQLSSQSPPPSPRSEDNVEPGGRSNVEPGGRSSPVPATLLTTWIHQPPGLAAKTSPPGSITRASRPPRPTSPGGLQGQREEAFRLGLRHGRRRGQEGSPAGAGGASTTK
mmetsp:Transcript_2773/g.6128  ORF Transcript_2773/g.6128 Transcript_2773/m.6128 type:complete len:204 (+) Transcript_2773:1336-1947(+)